MRVIGVLLLIVGILVMLFGAYLAAFDPDHSCKDFTEGIIAIGLLLFLIGGIHAGLWGKKRPKGKG